MSNLNGSKGQPSPSSIIGATTLVLLGTELERSRRIVHELRTLSRSELLPRMARDLLDAAAQQTAEATLYGSMHLQALEEDNPAAADVAGCMAAELREDVEGEANPNREKGGS